MNPNYFKAKFNIPDYSTTSWVMNFFVITAFNPVFEDSYSKDNGERDLRLKEMIEKFGVMPKRVIGFDPESGHSEPGWSIPIKTEESDKGIDFELACDTGLQFGQEAIFIVKDQKVFISYCDDRREERFFDSFENMMQK